MTLTQTLAKFSENVQDQWFNWDEESKTWNIAGHDKNGNYFETDDYDAENRDDAESDAIDYLEAYNEPA